MAHLLGFVVLIGIVDSLNPSTVAPALYFAGGRDPHRSLLGFITGVFGVNLAAGVVLALGPGQAILALAPHPGFVVRRAIELALGLAAFVLAAVLWRGRARLGFHVSGVTERIDRSSLFVGAGITAAELPTALPYFAVIAAVVDSDRSVGTQVALLTVFNLVFVAPLLAILVVRGLLGTHGRAVLERARAWLERHLATAIPAVVLVVGILLVGRGTLGLVRHR